MPEDLPAGVKSSINLITAALQYNDLTNGNETPPSLRRPFPAGDHITVDEEEIMYLSRKWYLHTPAWRASRAQLLRKPWLLPRIPPAILPLPLEFMPARSNRIPQRQQQHTLDKINLSGEEPRMPCASRQNCSVAGSIIRTSAHIELSCLCSVPSPLPWTMDPSPQPTHSSRGSHHSLT